MFEPRAVSHLVTWQDGRCSSEFLASLWKALQQVFVSSQFWWLEGQVKVSADLASLDKCAFRPPGEPNIGAQGA